MHTLRRRRINNAAGRPVLLRSPPWPPLRMYVLTIETERGAAQPRCWVAPEAKVCARGFVNKVGRAVVGFVLIILSGLLRIWGLRYEICRLVPLHYVHYLTALLPPSS